MATTVLDLHWIMRLSDLDRNASFPSIYLNGAFEDSHREADGLLSAPRLPIANAPDVGRRDQLFRSKPDIASEPTEGGGCASHPVVSQ
ncbi:MAG: hypothetical protein E5Y10_33480 [Mesorhizobium sp.]|uniref:hypothetical protein n=1 Tax=Mesorhizobium sp. TaxID=1871066 RepID=UPI001201A285|nr:hypothetical protein [Mesorhizobium sp.]TIN40414.1 MAG: hypothetical protein E5Y13_11535 [Mesorhizobium sp.]TJU83800.1 MAG: hypothetical protein E5Y10_33480 [Mesorhizobium sp.]